MKGQKIIEVIEAYERRLSAAGIPKKRMDPNRTFQRLSPEELLAHAYHLCGGAKEYAADEARLGKANRHLTAIQMCLSFAGWYTLAELMEHNRPVSDGI
jgi:hypothetical protein